jgi:hypothetical protein
LFRHFISSAGSVDLHQFLEDVIIRRPYFVVRLNKSPTHDTFSIDDECGRMRDWPFCLVVEQSVAIDHPMVSIREQREI